MDEGRAYGIFITNEILSKRVHNWNKVPCDISFEKCNEIYGEFSLNLDIERSEYDQLTEWIRDTYLYELVTIVECGACGSCEERSADEQRKHFQAEYLGTTDVSDDDIFICHSCSSLVIARTSHVPVNNPFYELTRGL